MWQLIKDTRREYKLSQSELSSRAQVSLATLQNIEAGKANPSLSNLIAILDVLGLDLKLEQKSTSSDFLARIGVPIGGFQNPIESHVYSSELLYKKLLLINPFSIKEERHRKALNSYLIAIQDHYPNFWEKIKNHYEAWIQKEKNKNLLSPKLRRISLSFLKELL